MKVQFSNPRTGQVKSVKVGWNWGLFLSGGFIGLPLFLNGLCMWGAVMASLWIFSFIIMDGTASVILSGIGVGLCIYLGARGSEIIAKKYLMHGWRWLNPESDTVNFAKNQWGLNTETRESSPFSSREPAASTNDFGAIVMEPPRRRNSRLH
jgi:hypothetical protein